MSQADQPPTTPAPRGGRPSPIEAGSIYGRLTAIERAYVDTGKSWRWRFRCECGREITVRASAVASGNTRSCGCARTGWKLSEDRKRRGSANPNFQHGMTGSPEHMVWKGIIARCTNPNYEHWDRYGGRGITMCERWFTSFEAFFADMGPRPSPSHSIDRRDNDGNYEPGNCQWALPNVQRRNQTRNRIVEYRGRTMPLVDACELAALPYNTVRRRIDVSGWPIEMALSEPVRTDRRPPR